MRGIIKKGDKGAKVKQVQRLLVKRGYPIKIDGNFGRRTQAAAKAFQSQNLDQHGQPLTVDGKIGPLTWWSLNHPKPDIRTPGAIDYLKMPPRNMGGSARGRAALKSAIGQLKAGAREIGGNNRGPWVRKYLKPTGLKQGNPWCAAFVSWCFLQACKGNESQMPFSYSPGARAIRRQFKRKGWTFESPNGRQPKSGDLVVWWRGQFKGWQGHVGLVHQVRDGMLYTIEGNRGPRVQGFSYVLSRMEKLLGFCHAP